VGPLRHASSAGGEDSAAAAAGLALCAIVAVVDLAAAHGALFSPLLALGPLVTAALRGGAGVTGVVAAVAASVAVVVGIVDQRQDWLDHTVAVTVVAAGGALATAGAALRERSARLVADRTQAERQLHAILANLGEAVVVRAPDGTIVYANQAAADVLGLSSPEELKATDPKILVQRFAHFDAHGIPLDDRRSLSARALAGESPAPQLVHRVERATGRERWLVQKATPVRDAEGRVVLAISVFEDVTAVRRAERHQRLLAEASKLIT
jgi:PAS domain S-box-containing protein